MKAIIVIPTIREKHIKEFLKAWEHEFKDHLVFVVEDNEKKTFKLKGKNIRHFSHEDIEKDLGDKAWIINRKDPSVGAYGLYKAWRQMVYGIYMPDMIVMLNDDCMPFHDVEFLKDHWSKLSNQVSNDWFNPLWSIYPRGYPYKNRDKQVMLNMGLWKGIPDVDALTQLLGYGGNYHAPNAVVPKNTYFALCDMNVAFRPGATPFMYEFARDRFGDIWMGIRAKREFDKRDWAITLGEPLINHNRASDPYANLIKEAKHLEENETFYKKPLPNKYKRKVDIWMSLFQ